MLKIKYCFSYDDWLVLKKHPEVNISIYKKIVYCCTNLANFHNKCQMILETKGIMKPAIRRLARRGDVKRISGLIYEETRGDLKAFLKNVIRDAVTYNEHAKLFESKLITLCSWAPQGVVVPRNHNVQSLSGFLPSFSASKPQIE